MALDSFSFLNSIDSDFVDELHQRYLVDKRLVEQSWRQFFDGYEFAKVNYSDENEIPTNVKKEFMVINLIDAYRSRGHLFTKTNPVRERRKYRPTLDIKNFGLDEGDLITVFQAGEQIGLAPSTLNEIVSHLEETYCQSIGIEYQYIRHPERVEWIRKNIESGILDLEEEERVVHQTPERLRPPFTALDRDQGIRSDLAALTRTLESEDMRTEEHREREEAPIHT